MSINSENIIKEKILKEENITYRRIEHLVKEFKKINENNNRATLTDIAKLLEMINMSQLAILHELTDIREKINIKEI